MNDAIPPNKLWVEFRDSKKLVFSGEAVAVSARNSKGPFDILPQHAHFISIINQELLIYTKVNQPQKFTLTTGILKCIDNKVTIFTGFESDADRQSQTS
jgi:F0F1-type ATP synthase epsilon subunit